MGTENGWRFVNKLPLKLWGISPNITYVAQEMAADSIHYGT